MRSLSLIFFVAMLSAHFPVRANIGIMIFPGPENTTDKANYSKCSDFTKKILNHRFFVGMLDDGRIGGPEDASFKQFKRGRETVTEIAARSGDPRFPNYRLKATIIGDRWTRVKKIEGAEYVRKKHGLYKSIRRSAEFVVRNGQCTPLSVSLEYGIHGRWEKPIQLANLNLCKELKKFQRKNREAINKCDSNHCRDMSRKIEKMLKKYAMEQGKYAVKQKRPLYSSLSVEGRIRNNPPVVASKELLFDCYYHGFGPFIDDPKSLGESAAGSGKGDVQENGILK